MKKAILMLLAVIIALFSVGCGNSGTDASSSSDIDQTLDDFSVTNGVAEKLDSNLPTSVIARLEGGSDGVSTIFFDGTIRITASVKQSSFIPTVADALCPVVVEVTSEFDYPFDLEIESHDSNDYVDVYWSTEDGEKGKLIDTTESVAKSNVTIDDLYRYFGQEKTE